MAGPSRCSLRCSRCRHLRRNRKIGASFQVNDVNRTASLTCEAFDEMYQYKTLIFVLLTMRQSFETSKTVQRTFKYTPWQTSLTKTYILLLEAPSNASHSALNPFVHKYPIVPVAMYYRHPHPYSRRNWSSVVRFNGLAVTSTRNHMSRLSRLKAKCSRDSSLPL